MSPARVKTQVVLFLCTGNYYRSRFAEVFFNHLAEQRGLRWRAVSRGLAPEFGTHNVGPMSRNAVGRLQTHGIVHAACERMPQRVNEDDLAAAALVVALKEAEHRPLLRERFAGWEARVEYWHVHDVDCATPAEALPQIEQQVRELAERLQ